MLAACEDCGRVGRLTLLNGVRLCDDCIRECGAGGRGELTDDQIALLEHVFGDDLTIEVPHALRSRGGIDIWRTG